MRERKEFSMEHVGSFNFGRSHRFHATSIRLLLICTDLVKYICLPHIAEPRANLYLWINTQTHTFTGSQIVHTKLMAHKYGVSNTGAPSTAWIAFRQIYRIHQITFLSQRHQMKWNKRDEAGYSWRSLVATLVCAKYIRAVCNTNVPRISPENPISCNAWSKRRTERSCSQFRHQMISL